MAPWEGPPTCEFVDVWAAQGCPVDGPVVLKVGQLMMSMPTAEDPFPEGRVIRNWTLDYRWAADRRVTCDLWGFLLERFPESVVIVDAVD